MNGNTRKFKIINCVGDATYLQDGKVYPSPKLEGCSTTALTGFDGQARCLEEHCLWNRQVVDADVVRKPGWFADYLSDIIGGIAVELSEEERDRLVIADLEHVRLNQGNPARFGEALTYTRESLFAIRQMLSQNGRLAFYDLPYQDHEGASEDYLNHVMPEILPLVDVVVCLLYVPGPGWEPAKLRAFIRANIGRCKSWAQGKPVYAMVWDAYVETDAGPLTDIEWEIILDECDRAGMLTLLYWDSLKGADDFNRVQKFIPTLRLKTMYAVAGRYRKSGEPAGAVGEAA